jgi:DNA-binding CsgD family transcriptional regulator
VNTKSIASARTARQTAAKRSTAPSAEAQSEPVGEINVANQACILICVNDRKPLTKIEDPRGRTRFQYAPREIVHFELSGKLFALCLKDATPSLPSSDTDQEAMRQLLTNRELQIVHMVCHGLLTKQIADRLQLSEFTVKTYLKSVFNKLGVKSRAAMVFRCASWIGTNAARS